ICMYVNGTITDKVVAGFQRRKAVLIVSDQSQLIAEAILSELGRGVTFLHGQGAFTRKEKNIAMAVVNLTQIAKVKLIAHTIDPTAFMIIISANEVEGPGFSQPGRKILDRFDAKRDEIHAEER
ncbi:MAG: YitT family protein, partial [Selenomonas sp.]